MTIINYFFEVVVPQILEYLEENKEEIINYSLLEILKKDKKYQEQIERILNTKNKNMKGE